MCSQMLFFLQASPQCWQWPLWASALVSHSPKWPTPPPWIGSLPCASPSWRLLSSSLQRWTTLPPYRPNVLKGRTLDETSWRCWLRAVRMATQFRWAADFLTTVKDKIKTCPCTFLCQFKATLCNLYHLEITALFIVVVQCLVTGWTVPLSIVSALCYFSERVGSQCHTHVYLKLQVFNP